MLVHIHVLSFFPRTEKMTKHKKWNKNRILVLGKRYVYLYRLTIHKVGNKTVFFVRLGKMKVILWCPESFIRVRPYVFLLVLCRYKYISIFVYLNLNFFMVTCVICRRLRLKYCRYGEKPQSIKWMWFVYKFQTLDNKQTKIKHLVIGSSYMSMLLSV